MEENEKIISEVSVWDTVTIQFESEKTPEEVTLIESGKIWKRGYVSIESDIGKKIYGAKLGDVLAINYKNGGQEKFKILKIKKPSIEEMKGLKAQLEKPKDSIKRYNSYDD